MLYTFNQLISFLINTAPRRLFFACLAGIILSTTLAFIGISAYVWLGLIPLILLIKSSPDYKGLAIEGFVFFFAYNLISFSWLLGLHPLTWQGFSISESLIITSLAWVLPSLFHTLVLIPFVILTKVFFEFRTNERSYELKFFDILLLAFVWVVIEHKILLGLGPNLGVFSVPINLLVFSQYQNKVLIQAANTIGAIGIEYIIITCNLLLSNFFNVQRSNFGFSISSKLNIRQPYFGVQNLADHLKYFGIVLVVVVLIIGYGFQQIYSYSQEPKKTKSFAALQADYSAAKTRSQSASPENLAMVQYQLSSVLTERKDLLIWSEGAVPLFDKDDLQKNLLIQLYDVSDLFVYGTFSLVDNKVYNSVDFIEFVSPLDDKSSVTYMVDHYHKKNLVPFGEYTPFYGILPSSIKKLADFTVGNGFDSNLDGVVPIQTKHGKIAANICFELLFPKLIRNQVLNGANFIINFNDLSWFKSPFGGFAALPHADRNSFGADWVKKQFLAVAVFRAVENRRNLILAGNSGYSALIDSVGKISLITRANKISMLEGYVELNTKKSRYTMYGW
jgi:apolipoprotein N-acyltransferase